MPLVQFKVLGMMLKSIISTGSLHSTLKALLAKKVINVMVGAGGEAGEKWEGWDIIVILNVL